MASNPGNPRTTLGDLTKLVKSLQSQGQIESITVVAADRYAALFPEHAAAAAGVRVVAVTGARRLAALTLAGLATVDITLKNELCADRATLVGAALVENIDRADLDPIDEATGLGELIREAGGQQAAGDRIGKSQGWLSQRIGLLRLVDQLQDEVRAGNLKIEPARRLSKLSPEQQLAGWRALQGPDITTVISGRPSPKPAQVRRALDTLGEDWAKRLTVLKDTFPEEHAELVTAALATLTPEQDDALLAERGNR